MTEQTKSGQKIEIFYTVSEPVVAAMGTRYFHNEYSLTLARREDLVPTAKVIRQALKDGKDLEHFHLVVDGRMVGDKQTLLHDKESAPERNIIYRSHHSKPVAAL